MSNEQSPEHQLGSAVYKAFNESAGFKLVLHVGDEKFTVVDNDAFKDGIIQKLKLNASALIRMDEWKELPIELRCKIMEESLLSQVSELPMMSQTSRKVSPHITDQQIQRAPASQMGGPPIQNMLMPLVTEINPQSSQTLTAFQTAVVSAIRSGFPQGIDQKTLIDEEIPSTENQKTLKVAYNPMTGFSWKS